MKTGDGRRMQKRSRRYAAQERLQTALRRIAPALEGRRRCALGSATILCLITIGCTSRPSRIEVPDYDPEQIGAQAVTQYDKDGDNSLSAEELGEVRSLESAMGRLDKDGDSKLTADEIAKRIEFYNEFKAGLVPVYCTLVRAGRPVAGAAVTYEPEAFMGESIVPAFGTTNSRGTVIISMAEEHLPSPAFKGVKPGFYRIRVTLADGSEVKDLNAGVETAGDVMNTHTFALP